MGAGVAEATPVLISVMETAAVIIKRFDRELTIDLTSYGKGLVTSVSYITKLIISYCDPKS